MNKQFLDSIHSYRGFAIIIIVLGHSMIERFPDEYPITMTLLKGGTALFVFISGYLFYYLQKGRFNYLSFIRKKFNYVFLPYIICSAPILIWFTISNKTLNPYSEYTYPTLVSFFTGYHMTAYWYIPYIGLVFLSSPVILRFSELSNKVQLIILFVASLIAIYIHRSPGNANTIHQYFRYVPFFLMGIYYCINREVIGHKLRNNRYFILLAIGIIIAIVQTSYFGHVGNYYKPEEEIWQFKGFDLIFVQKIFMVVFFYIFFENFFTNSKALSFIANYSFPIYFIHGYVERVLRSAFDIHIVLEDNFHNSLIESTILFILVFGFSVLIAYAIKLILGKRSRYVIGG